MENLSLTFPYSHTDLTDQIDVIPNLYGLVNRELKLFPAEGSTARVIEIRYDQYNFRVLPAKDVGTGPTPQIPRSGQTLFIEVPHFPMVDLILPGDIQDILVQVARSKRPTTVEEETNKRLAQIKWTHDITREWLMCTALQGNILDGNSQSIVNLYTFFGISATTVDFTLGTSTTDMIGKCATIWQNITQNLHGEVMSGIEVIVDPTFFERFVTHANVAQYYLNAEQARILAQLERRRSNPMAGQMWGREFYFQNILFREYYGTAPVKTSPSAASLTTTPFWPANTGTAFPVGTRDMFRCYDAPAWDVRFANTTGQEVYVSPRILDHGEGIEMKSESNALPICRRPAALVQLISSN